MIKLGFILGTLLVGTGVGLYTNIKGGATHTVTLPAEVSIAPAATETNVIALAKTGTKTVKNLSLGSDQVVFITGEIGDGSAEIAASITKKARSGKPIYLLIDSPGGSVMDGGLIISAMEASKAPVYTVCRSICASMAAMIFSYGKERLMVDRSILMYHPAAGQVGGTLQEMQSLLSTITLYVDKMNNHVAIRAGVTVSEFQAMWISQLWMDAETSIEKKLADGLVNIDLDDKVSIFSTDKSANKIKEKFNIQW